jgi:cytochrome b
VFVHVSCVVLVSLALGENLPLAMITGKKRVKKSNDIVG